MTWGRRQLAVRKISCFCKETPPCLKFRTSHHFPLSLEFLVISLNPAAFETQALLFFFNFYKKKIGSYSAKRPHGERGQRKEEVDKVRETTFIQKTFELALGGGGVGGGVNGRAWKSQVKIFFDWKNRKKQKDVEQKRRKKKNKGVGKSFFSCRINENIFILSNVISFFVLFVLSPLIHHSR